MCHLKEVCEYGYVHAQCRCMAPNKTIERVTCDRPDHKQDRETGKAYDPPANSSPPPKY